MTLTQFIRQTADMASRSGGTVNIDSRFGTVAIEWDSGECFLQGDEGDSFIEKVRDMWNTTGDTTEEECALCEAWPYIENLSE